MLIFHGTDTHKKLQKWTELQSKNNTFFHHGQTIPKFKIFFWKKHILTPYKSSQALRLEAMDQNIPRSLKSIPFGILFKAENSEKLEEKHNNWESNVWHTAVPRTLLDALSFQLNFLVE